MIMYHLFIILFCPQSHANPAWDAQMALFLSTEVCPFCGKTYKRLKSHLPHCKAAAVAKTPLTQRNVTGNKTSSQLDTGGSKTKAKGKKTTLLTTHTLNTEVSAVEETSSSPQTPSLSLSSSCRSSSSPPSVKKKPKLSEQIKMASIVSSNSASLISSPSLSLSPSPVPSKPKRKSLRALIEASASNQVSAGSASEDLPSGSATQSPDAVSLCSRTGTQSGTKTKEEKDSLTHTKSKGASKKKVSVSKSRRASATVDSKGNERSERPKSLVGADAEEERAYLPGNEMLWKSRSSKITLQDVKSTLGRAKPSRTPIMGQIEMCHDLSNNSQTSERPVLEGYHKDVRSLDASELQKEPTAVGRQKSKPASLIPLKHVSVQCTPTSPAAPLHLSLHVIQTTPSQLPVSRNDGPTGHHSPSLNTLSSPRVCPLTTQTPTADEGLAVKKPQLEFRNTNAAGDGRGGQVAGEWRYEEELVVNVHLG